MKSMWSIKPKFTKNTINFNWLLFYRLVFVQVYSESLHTIQHSHLTNLFVLLTRESSQTKTSLARSDKYLKPTLDRRHQYNSKFKTPTSRRLMMAVGESFTKTFDKSLFELYLRFTQISPTTFFKPHGAFLTYFITNSNGVATFVNISKTYSRWVNFINLVKNIFTNEINTFLFTTASFRQECVAFNWTEKCLEYELFKRSTPYFFKKDIQFGSDSITIFNRLERSGLSTVFLTDPQYHWKNLFYLKRVGIYTISTTPLNANPWNVHFSLPAGSNNLISQYFFIKLITMFKHEVKLNAYQSLKKLWQV